MQKAPQAVLFRCDLQRSAGDFFEHFEANFAICDFAQGRHCWFVLALDFCGMALAQHAGTISRSQNELKAVRDFFEAVFNGNAGHGDLR